MQSMMSKLVHFGHFSTLNFSFLAKKAHQVALHEVCSQVKDTLTNMLKLSEGCQKSAIVFKASSYKQDLEVVQALV